MKQVIKVPGNVSRLFATKCEAISQQTGNIDLDFHQHGYIHNKLYNASLTKHDKNYCSTNPLHLVESLNVFAKLTEYIRNQLQARVVDVGCGQGEFVTALRGQGFDAVGFDPVLRIQSKYLSPRYFGENEKKSFEEDTVIFSMRCVLPHVENPWGFLDWMILKSKIKGKKYAYIEYQQTEWIVANGIWQQVSHDHVNLFTLANFQNRYQVLSTGEFSEGEWRWVLLGDGEISNGHKLLENPISISGINSLIVKRSRDLSAIAQLGDSLAIYGAAGKGAMLAHAIVTSIGDSINLVAVDQDPNRTGLFLESSGIEVKSLEFLKLPSERKRVVLVANPNHLTFIQRHLQWDRLKVI